MKKILNATAGFALILTMLSAGMVQTMFASSHQEAPFIARDRYADNTDTYAFRSIEPDRDDYVTFIANYIPFQQPSGGPHFFRWDDTVLYEIRVDNTGDGVEDMVYQFQFTTQNHKRRYGPRTRRRQQGYRDQIERRRGL